MIAYFHELALGNPADAAFQKAFDMDPAAFEAMLVVYLRTLIGK